MTQREPLDTFDIKPKGMVAYLRYNGYHFNRSLCEWAVSQMTKENPSTGKQEPVEAWSKDEVDTLLSSNAIKLEHNTGYDYVFTANMAKSDFFKSSLPTEAYVARFVKDYVDDPDQADGFIFNRFYADCVRKGLGIPWSEVV